MNLVDLVIIAIVVLSAVHGMTQGAALQILSFGGFWIGLLVGATLAPVASHLTHSPFGSSFLSLLTFLGAALAGGAIGRYIGTHAWGALQRLKLGGADAIVGSAVAVVAALGAVWLIALLLAYAPSKDVAKQVNRSAIVRALVVRLPAAPGVFARLQALISTTPFPRVFSGLEPLPTGPVDIPSDPIVRAAVAKAQASTVRVSGLGCGGIQTGSGFVAAPGLIVTNAHVVAGIDKPTVQDRSGTHAATAVLFDPNLDIAILRTGALAGGPLPLLGSDVGRGQGGAVLGYPGGGGFNAGAGAVIREFNAIGRDIYGRHETRRNVYQLQAQVRQGNSGGPFVRQDGTVLAVIFAASTTDSNIGYALTSSEVVSEVQQAEGRTNEVDTGPCAA